MPAHHAQPRIAKQGAVTCVGNGCSLSAIRAAASLRAHPHLCDDFFQDNSADRSNTATSAGSAHSAWRRFAP
jgi:hypothetical protein